MDQLLALVFGPFRFVIGIACALMANAFGRNALVWGVAGVLVPSFAPMALVLSELWLRAVRPERAARRRAQRRARRVARAHRDRLDHAQARLEDFLASPLDHARHARAARKDARRAEPSAGAATATPTATAAPGPPPLPGWAAPEEATFPPPPPPRPDLPADEWFFARRGRKPEGPFTLQEARERALLHRLERDLLVWHPSMREWKPVGESPLAAV